MRPGNAGANSAGDHIRVFEAAVSGLAAAYFASDGALAGEKSPGPSAPPAPGASRKFLWYQHSQNVQFSISTLSDGQAHLVNWINCES